MSLLAAETRERPASELRRIRRDGTIILSAHNDAPWKSLRKGLDVYE